MVSTALRSHSIAIQMNCKGVACHLDAPPQKLGGFSNAAWALETQCLCVECKPKLDPFGIEECLDTLQSMFKVTSSDRSRR